MPRNDIARPSFSVFQLLFNPSSLSFSRIDILDQFVASFGQNANRGSSILARFEINFFLLGFLTEKNDKPLSEIKGDEDRVKREEGHDISVSHDSITSGSARSISSSRNLAWKGAAPVFPYSTSD